MAEAELTKAGKKAERLNDAGAQLMKCFGAAQQGTNNKQKRLATLAIVNQLFKIYFKLNTLRLCKNVIKAKSPRRPDLLAQSRRPSGSLLFPASAAQPLRRTGVS